MAEVRATARLNVRQAAFIGVGAMVGAGIFSLLGAAGEVAGAAVWVSFAIAGAIALLQGYSFAKFGARYPSAGGLLEYVVQGLGNGHATGIVAWLILAANAIVTSMVAVSFGSYASSALTDGDTAWIKVFAVLLVLVMTVLNIVGSQAVAKIQTVIVFVVLGSLSLFAVTTLANLDTRALVFLRLPILQRHHLERSSHVLRVPRVRRGHVHGEGPREPCSRTPTCHLSRAWDRNHHLHRRSTGRLRHPQGGRGDRVGGTALAVAAEPVLGRAGYWLMSVTALFSTAGATNAGLYPAAGLCEQMTSLGQFPPMLGRRFGGRAPAGLLLTAAVSIILAVGFDLSSIASIGSAIALLVFTLITAAHFRVRSETGANAAVLGLGVASTAIVLVTFAFTTLVDEPATAAALCVILLLSLGADLGWKRFRGRNEGQS